MERAYRRMDLGPVRTLGKVLGRRHKQMDLESHHQSSREWAHANPPRTQPTTRGPSLGR
jgi:hypothetical protein